MDARVARLEAHVETLRSESAATRGDVTEIRVGVATLIERSGALAEAVAALTGRADRSDERMASLTVRVATLEERVDHLPTKGFAVTALGTALTMVSGLILFSEQLKALIGV
jgi:hypothetical protein